MDQDAAGPGSQPIDSDDDFKLKVPTCNNSDDKQDAPLETWRRELWLSKSRQMGLE